MCLCNGTQVLCNFASCCRITDCANYIMKDVSQTHLVFCLDAVTTKEAAISTSAFATSGTAQAGESSSTKKTCSTAETGCAELRTEVTETGESAGVEFRSGVTGQAVAGTNCVVRDSSIAGDGDDGRTDGPNPPKRCRDPPETSAYGANDPVKIFFG